MSTTKLQRPTLRAARRRFYQKSVNRIQDEFVDAFENDHDWQADLEMTLFEAAQICDSLDDDKPSRFLRRAEQNYGIAGHHQKIMVLLGKSGQRLVVDLILKDIRIKGGLLNLCIDTEADLTDGENVRLEFDL